MRYRAGILAVAAREIAWIRRDRAAFLLVFGIPLIAFALLASTFSNAVIRNLRVDVVDQDHSQASMTFVQAVDAAPGVTVARRSDDLDGAMHAVRSGDVLATVYLPRNLERDVQEGRRPQVVIFFNKQYFTAGNIASSALQGRSARLQRRCRRAVGAGRAMRPGRSSSSNMCSPIPP